jgi:hypothetical protein
MIDKRTMYYVSNSFWIAKLIHLKIIFIDITKKNKNNIHRFRKHNIVMHNLLIFYFFCEYCIFDISKSFYCKGSSVT